MISGIFVKIISIFLLVAVGIVLILGIGTLFKGGETSKKYSNKLMQLRVLLQFIAILAKIAMNCNKTLNCINLFEYFLLVSPPLNKVPIPSIRTIPTATSKKIDIIFTNIPEIIIVL